MADQEKVPEQSKEREEGREENGEAKTKEKKTGQFLDPQSADAVAQTEFQQKYGFVKKPPAIAQRKISQGGKQYFDSGDYNMHASKKDRQEIASHPRAMNPHMAQLRAKAVISKSTPSKLASGSPPSQLASAAPRKSPLAQ